MKPKKKKETPAPIDGENIEVGGQPLAWHIQIASNGLTYHMERIKNLEKEVEALHAAMKATVEQVAKLTGCCHEAGIYPPPQTTQTIGILMDEKDVEKIKKALIAAIKGKKKSDQQGNQDTRNN